MARFGYAEGVYNRIGGSFDFTEPSIIDRLKDFFTRGHEEKAQPKTVSLARDIIAIAFKEQPTKSLSLADIGDSLARADIEPNFIERVASEIDGKTTIRQLKGLVYRDSRAQEQLDNRSFNFVLDKARGLRDAKDVSGLKDLKGEVDGLKFDTELRNEIDNFLNSVRG